MKSQAIVLRAREESGVKKGLGQLPANLQSDSDAVSAQIFALAGMIAQMAPGDLTAAQMTKAIAAIGNAFNKYNADIEAALASAASTTPQTATTQTPASGGVSPTAAAFIALGSALSGGAVGYYVRGRK